MTQLEADRGRTNPTASAGRVPPNALEMEESLIGAMLLSPEAVSVAYETVEPEDFYRPLHAQIFSAILALANAGEPVDYVTVQAKLQEQGAAAVEVGLLSSLQMNTPSAANARHYAEIVHEKAQQRRLIAVAGEIVDDAYVATDDVVGLIDDAERKINQIGDTNRIDSVSPLQRLLVAEANILEERGETRGQFNGLETGYRSLDLVLQGLQPHSLTIVGARPAMGKTAFALGILTHVGAVVNRPALFFSLEMSRQELAERILASTARIDSSKLRTGDLSDADWNRAQDAFGYLQSAKVFIDDNPSLTVMDVRSRARRIKQQNGDLGVVIIDYLQLMSSRGRAENRQVEVSEMSRALKILARELSCPVIALSQLSRKLEERADKRPMMSDLRESGSLEQDADVVLFLYRAEQYGEVPNDKKSEAEIIVGKNRNGPTRTAHLTWRGEFARFDNVADTSNF
ncbi:MAG: replicative DNA helicase [Acidobacteriota bacterium]|nr:replicative DNA helicase [Acidobacteriota bacterium]MDE3030658.1 replicative DNA helicase [Acidobacteriota bacterium]MDE3093320.1 replicative DNA helicase [Acidobacteriota bacterium]MDE3138213.1 replicative DNA helicase [Acidobacteriota bacterium]MDE3146707.1 replicative DNA helicase [Acidobacteriota bacterium]